MTIELKFECLGSEGIVDNPEDNQGVKKIERVAGANAFKIKRKRFKQFDNFDPEESGMRETPEGTTQFEIKYRKTNHNVSYDVRCFQGKGRNLKHYFL